MQRHPRGRTPATALQLPAFALAFALVAFVLPPSAAAQSPPVFAEPIVLPVDGVPGLPRVADLNGDGRMDLVASCAGGVQVWLGTERSMLVRGALTGYGLGTINLVDLDGDGLHDIVGVAESDSPGVCWARGDGHGGFGPPRSLLRTTSWGGAAAGDFDGDGHCDVAAVTAEGELVLLRNQGTGEFAEHGTRMAVASRWPMGVRPSAPGERAMLATPEIVSQETPYCRVRLWQLEGEHWTLVGEELTAMPINDHQFGHLDGDGVLDWCGFFETGEAWVARGLPVGGTWDVAPVACRSGTFGNGAIGDLDGDGLDDIVMPSRSDYWRRTRLEIYYSRPDGSRDNGIRLTLPPGWIGGIRVADFDGDGWRDIAAFVTEENQGGDPLVVFRNRGGRRFDAITHWPSDENSRRVFAAQLDRSPAKELVVLSESHFGACALDGARMPLPPHYLAPAPSVLAWRNGTPVYFRDVNGDGFDDLLMRNGDSFSFALATGDGTMGELVHHPWPGFAAVGDLDGRFGGDAVFLDGEGRLSVAFRTASGTYMPPVATSMRARSFSSGAPLLRCADLDRDGRDELIVGQGWRRGCDEEQSEADSLFILRWNVVDLTMLQSVRLHECPEWASPWDYDGYQPFLDLSVLDIDGVGMLDIAVLTGGERGRVTPLTDGGEGFHTPSANGWIPREYPDELAEGDFDGDGWTELASAHNYEGGIAHVAVLRFAGSVESSNLPGAFISENGVTSVAAGDFDGDGDDDLATLHWTGGWNDWWDETGALAVHWSMARENAAITTVAGSGARGARTAQPTQAVRIAAAWPNPARDAVHVRFATLPSGEARLELLDVTGRRVQERRLAASPGGGGVARFELGRDLSPGVYWLRLAQDGVTSSTRIAIVR